MINKWEIYKIMRPEIDNAVYYGLHHCNLVKNYMGTGVIITRSLRKYGKKRHIKIILLYANDLESANLYEQFFIKWAKEHNEILLNINQGGGGNIGYRHTDKAKEKIGKASKNRIISEETKIKMSIAKTGLKIASWSEERRAKQPKIKKPYKKWSEEARKRMSERSKKMWKNGVFDNRPDQKGKIVSVETKNKLKIAALKQWERQKEGKNG